MVSALKRAAGASVSPSRATTTNGPPWMGWMKPLLEPMKRTLSVSKTFILITSVEGKARPLIVKNLPGRRPSASRGASDCDRTRVRYTGEVVRFRSVAFIVALLVAAGPVTSVVCALDCDRPASPPCHGASTPHNDLTWQVTPHACGHDHLGGSVALLSSASVRHMVEISFAAPNLMPVLAILPKLDRATTSALNGPPGLMPRSTSFQITVLRV